MPARSTQTLQDDRFLLLEAVGRGGMGSVYRAFDRVEQRMVALKTLDGRGPRGAGHPLAAEFEVWGRLRHANVIRALGFGWSRSGPIDDGAPYLVLEYFPGRPAHQVLAPGRCSPAGLEEFARRVLRGLAYVHARGLVHRDLKPANVLVRGGRRAPGRVKLTDFGLAERVGYRDDPGVLSGSLPYVAPETMIGAGVDGRSDLYGLGMLLYFLATGSLAAPSRDPAEVVRWHLSAATPDPRRVRPEISERLARFILRLTRRPPDERPASAEEALSLLGAGGAAGAARTSDVVGRAERAAVRLAVDAARLGGRRALRLAGPAGEVADLVREAQVLAGIHGLGFHSLGSVEGGERGLTRLALEVLAGMGDRVPALVERHRLQRGLPLRMLGGIPVWDRMKEGAIDYRREGAARRATARAVVGLLLDTTRRRSLVLHVPAREPGDPLTREVLRALGRAIERDSRPRLDREGLLLLLESGSEQAGEDLAAAEPGAEQAAQRR